MSSKIDKELNWDPMLIHKSGHIHFESIETLRVDGEKRPIFHNKPLEGYDGHDWNINETASNEEDYRMDTNLTNDGQMTQIGSLRTGSTQSAQIPTIIDTHDRFIHDNPTILHRVANEEQNMKQQPIVRGVSDDHLVEHQIYLSKKELHQTLYIMALKNKFESIKTTKSMTKLLLVECFDKECKWQVCATNLGISNMFWIMKYYSTHTCWLDMMSHDNWHASNWLIDESIREIYQRVNCEL